MAQGSKVIYLAYLIDPRKLCTCIYVVPCLKKYQHWNENDCIIIEDQNIITNTKIIGGLSCVAFKKTHMQIHT